MRELPHRDDWDRWLGRHDMAGLAQLLDAAAFAQYELVSPRLLDGHLAGIATIDDVLVAIELCWGDLLTAGGPMIRVNSARLEASGLEPDLEGVLAEERDRLRDHARIEPGDLPQEAVEEPAWLDIDGEAHQVELRREGDVWAARCGVGQGTGVPDAVITVVGRGVRVEEVQLRRAGEVLPYVRRRREILAKLVEDLEQRPDDTDAIVPTSDRGLTAHLNLVTAALADHAQLRDAARSGRPVRYPTGQHGAYEELWHAAISAQGRLAAQTRSDATASVVSMVNHVVQLADRARWFQDPIRRREAIDEVVAYAVKRGNGPSRVAQEAWTRWWQQQSLLAEASLEAEARSEVVAGGMPDSWLRHEKEWLSAWRQWVRSR